MPAIVMVGLGWSSDRFHERRWHLVGGALLGASGLVVAGIFGYVMAVFMLLGTVLVIIATREATTA